MEVVKTLERGEATSPGSTQEPTRPDASVATLAAAVATTTSLMQRRLDVNRVTDDGMDAVAKAVTTNSSLCEMDFRINRVTDGGGGDDQCNSLTTLMRTFDLTRSLTRVLPSFR